MDWAKIFRPDGALLRVKKSAFIRVYLRLKPLRLGVSALKIVFIRGLRASRFDFRLNFTSARVASR